ncbi:MAG: glycoside hydrolase family 125 protein [Dethiobacteria bacterium]|nr:glycoside hydrolase family 125 protein [Bacillota bacterium]HOP68818.1 glycoside hydrolase family 125 protein [Bacillota bacterium]HPT34136.1 glycoside hydrolase family 125 protein [Bacillota bacterium]HQD06091.1 glycoside hydrolase family 125 protein [Bacillota bacterium]
MPEAQEKKMLLTVPRELPPEEALFLTGNEYLSLPEIDAAGRIKSLNLLHYAGRGLLEFRGGGGEPLLAPWISREGRPLDLNRGLGAAYRHYWIPSFRAGEPGQWEARGELAAPPGERGFIYRLTLTNLSPRAAKFQAGWQGCWREFNQVIFNRRRLEVRRVLSYDSWTKSLFLEARKGLPLAALALNLDPQAPWHFAPRRGRFWTGIPLELGPGESATVTLFAAVNLESDGAGTTTVHLKRRGSEALLQETEQWLERHRLELPDRRLTRVLNRNLFFNYYYALGRAMDNDRLVPVTSRSPRYYVSAAFWSRDTLLWSFPGLLLVDRAVARELLLTVFRRHLNHAGDHAHYINGTLLYPGFELDQLAAFILALERYETLSGDGSLIRESPIAEGLDLLVQKAEERRHEETGLYSTFLDPSDDPVPYPFLIYDNALLQRAFAYLAGLQQQKRWQHPLDFREAAERLYRAIRRHGTVEGPLGPMFAWAVDGRGGYRLYDNPPGSLQLLPHYGFCSPEDPVYRNTVAWIRSDHNPYFHRGVPFSETGSLHCRNPWPLAAANDLLALNRGGLSFLARAPMDNGFCCETVDPHSGKASTGAAFASGAGFLAYALWQRGRDSR